MKTERSDVEYPIWRKKVDTTLLKNACTPIPLWVMNIWNIELLFSQASSIKSQEAKVEIRFNKKIYHGYVTCSIKAASPFYRLFISKSLQEELKAHYMMSYMRTLEKDLRKNKTYAHDVEQDIPFWEFLDIEFDPSNKLFLFTAYYLQKPLFPEVFKSLIRSNVIKQFEQDNSLEFTKSNWIHRSELCNMIEVTNVIYYLLDSQNKNMYIGEAEKMLKRFDQGHSRIKDWDYFRYDKLPEGFSKKQRLSLERMIIRSFASLFHNSKDIPSMLISDFILSNIKIDK